MLRIAMIYAAVIYVTMVIHDSIIHAITVVRRIMNFVADHLICE